MYSALIVWNAYCSYQSWHVTIILFQFYLLNQDFIQNMYYWSLDSWLLWIFWSLPQVEVGKPLTIFHGYSALRRSGGQDESLNQVNASLFRGQRYLYIPNFLLYNVLTVLNSTVCSLKTGFQYSYRKYRQILRILNLFSKRLWLIF
jgi:hypothetical protein